MTYPKDIESGIQWRVRHQAPGSPNKDITRVVTEAQARAIESRLLSTLAPIVEARLITVGEWGPPEIVEAALAAEEPDDDEE